VPFTLDNSNATPGVVLNKYPINLIILNKFYSDEHLYSLDGSSTFKHPPILDVPEIAIQYIDHDAPIKLNLDKILNDSLANQRSYTHEWRRPDSFTTDDSTNWLIPSINRLLVIVVVPVLMYQQYRLRQVSQVLLVLQQAAPVQAIDFLVLTTLLYLPLHNRQ